jgi:NADPH-dependent F420 reductase
VGEQRHTIAVIGGTGPQGKGLAYRFAKHGHDVVIGSRSAERAAEAAVAIAGRGVTGSVTGATNEDTLAGADVVLLAVPYDGHDDLVAALSDGLAGKVVVSCVNPLGFDKQGPYGLDVDRSAAEAAAALVPTAQVTGAFHHVSAGVPCGATRSTCPTRTCWSAATTPTRSTWSSSSPRPSPGARA